MYQPNRNHDAHPVVVHGSHLDIAGVRASRHRVVTLSGYGARYGDYDGPQGPAKYAERAERNRGDHGRPHGRHNGVVWLSAEASVIAASYSQADIDREAGRIAVAVGDVIRVASHTPGEGGLYRIEAPRPNRLDGDDARLIPVTDDDESEV